MGNRLDDHLDATKYDGAELGFASMSDMADRAHGEGYYLDWCGVLQRESGRGRGEVAMLKGSQVIDMLAAQYGDDARARLCYDESLVDALRAGEPLGVNLLYENGDAIKPLAF